MKILTHVSERALSKFHTQSVAERTVGKLGECLVASELTIVGGISKSEFATDWTEYMLCNQISVWFLFSCKKKKKYYIIFILQIFDFLKIKMRCRFRLIKNTAYILCL